MGGGYVACEFKMIRHTRAVAMRASRLCRKLISPHSLSAHKGEFYPRGSDFATLAATWCEFDPRGPDLATLAQ